MDRDWLETQQTGIGRWLLVACIGALLAYCLFLEATDLQGEIALLFFLGAVFTYGFVALFLGPSSLSFAQGLPEGKHVLHLASSSLVAFCFGVAIGFFAGAQVARNQVRIAQERGDELALKVESFETNEERMPPNLAALFLHPLIEIPTTGVGVFRTRSFLYNAVNGSIGFATPLNQWCVRVPGGNWIQLE